MAETKGFSLADMLKDVSNLDTGANAAAGREQIVYLPIGYIHNDPNNFYQLTGIDELAANIELLGLQQPIRVRKGEGVHKYIIVSGHRRMAALRQLVTDGNFDYSDVPCIVEADASNAALQELRLIYANSDTRVLTSAELNKQAERVEMLLYELKKQGVEFPGRMRDHVAEACKLSKTKLARLKVIRDKLDPCFKRDYDKGTLSESAAYALAQRPAEAQRLIKKYEASGRNGSKYLGEYTIKSIADWYKNITATPCAKDNLPCSHINNMLEQSCGQNYGPCKSYTCCDKCYKLESCKAACPKLAEKVKKLKADTKAAQQQEKLARAEKERPDVELITALWRRFGEARKAASVSVAEFKAAEKVYSSSGEEEFLKFEQGTAKITANTDLPYGYSVSVSTVKYLLTAADMFGCSLDYLLCRTEAPGASAAQSAETASLKWNTGTPTKSGDYAAVFNLNGDPYRQIAYYNSVTNTWHFPTSNASIQAPVICWIKLPEVDIYD